MRQGKIGIGFDFFGKDQFRPAHGARIDILRRGRDGRRFDITRYGIVVTPKAIEVGARQMTKDHCVLVRDPFCCRWVSPKTGNKVVRERDGSFRDEQTNEFFLRSEIHLIWDDPKKVKHDLAAKKSGQPIGYDVDEASRFALNPRAIDPDSYAGQSMMALARMFMADRATDKVEELVFPGFLVCCSEEQAAGAWDKHLIRKRMIDYLVGSRHSPIHSEWAPKGAQVVAAEGRSIRLSINGLEEERVYPEGVTFLVRTGETLDRMMAVARVAQSDTLDTAAELLSKREDLATYLYNQILLEHHQMHRGKDLWDLGLMRRFPERINPTRDILVPTIQAQFLMDVQENAVKKLLVGRQGVIQWELFHHWYERPPVAPVNIPTKPVEHDTEPTEMTIGEETGVVVESEAELAVP